MGGLPTKLKCPKTGKIVHTNAHGARLAARRMREKTGDILTVYYCKFCSGSHIGHTPIYKQKRYHPTLKVQRLRYRQHGQ